MKTVIVILMFAVIGGARFPNQVPKTLKTVKVHVQGDSSRLSDFVEECQREFADHGLKLQLVSLDDNYEFNIVIAQESSLGGAAAAVIALDKKGIFVASVVRSGRMSGKGALNASAKELAKKLAVLASQQLDLSSRSYRNF